MAVFSAQFLHQRIRVTAFGRAQRGNVPFSSIAVFIGDERRLTAHRQTHITGSQITIHFFAEIENLLPLLIGVWLGDARRFVNPRDPHVVIEFHFALVHAAFDRRGGRGLGCAGERNVALASE